ncbi:MAG: type II secretion system F family protein [Candidatus Omnitrophica bacterium]|nr:type II secretion system F family protein [Candidatus Omnitrophota bacterium]
MPTFFYKARNEVGKPVKGTMDAPTKDELIDKLHKMGYMTTHIDEVTPEFRIEKFFDRLRPINAEDMIVFNVQLSNMINAGINILTSLSTLSDQIENRRLRDTIGDVSRGIEGGDTLSQALSRYPRVFPNIFISMVKAGEASGRLEAILARYAVFSEQQEDLRQKIRGALFYPAILLTAGIAVTLFLVTFIIPQFASVFSKTGVTLPLPTLILNRVGVWIKGYWYVVVLGGLLAYFGYRLFADTEGGRLKVDRLKLILPVMGPLHRKAAISRFARTLGTLVASGVPILEAIDIVRGVVGNEVIARVVKSSRDAVENGEKLAAPLKVSQEFPQDAVQMIAIGEETGDLDGMLNKISDFYDMYIGYSVKKLTSIIEPLFLLLLGALVAFIMASMLLPIFDMIKILRR